METGESRWYIFVYYLAPDDTSTIDSVIAALKERPQGTKLLVAGDFNAKLLEPEGSCRGEEILATLALEVLEDISAHFLPRRGSWCLDSRMCIMVRA